MRSMTKSPVALAKEALKVGQSGLPRYSSPFSRRDFTQAQLFAILVLRQFFRTDYRGVVQLLEDLSDLRKALHLLRLAQRSDGRSSPKQPPQLFRGPRTRHSI